MTTQLFFRSVRRWTDRSPELVSRGIHALLLPMHPAVTEHVWAAFCCLDYGILAAVQVHTGFMRLWSSSLFRLFIQCGDPDCDPAEVYQKFDTFCLAAVVTELANGALMQYLFWGPRHGLNMWNQLVHYVQQPYVRWWIVLQVTIPSIAVLISFR